jgi:hypothetical protein
VLNFDKNGNWQPRGWSAIVDTVGLIVGGWATAKGIQADFGLGRGPGVLGSYGRQGRGQDIVS